MRSDEMRGPGRVKEITSTANPIVKDIRALTQKRHREEQKAFLAEGQKLVVDALDQGWSVRTLIYAKNARERAGLADLAAKVIARGGDILEVSEKVLGAITKRDNPQTVLGVFEQRWRSLSKLRPDAGELWIGLEEVRDPGNLGTIIRTADAAGCAGILLIDECVDPFSLETVRATMGSIFALPLIRCDAAQFLAFRAGFGGKVVGTHLSGTEDYRRIDAGEGPTVLLMGNESRGLSMELANACDHLAIIPQAGRADSLNLAIATALMVFELRRDVLRLPETP